MSQEHPDDQTIPAKEELAAKLVRFLGTAQSVEEYVGDVPTEHHPNGYRFKKITHREGPSGI